MEEEGERARVWVGVRVRPDATRVSSPLSQDAGVGYEGFSFSVASERELQVQFRKDIKGRPRIKKLAFDHVFPKDAKQDDVHKVLGEKALKAFMQGENVVIACYGQTNSGKTHTIQGEINTQDKTINEQSGLIPRVLLDLQQFFETKERKFTISLVEIYQEKVNDLFDESLKDLSVYSDCSGNTQVFKRVKKENGSFENRDLSSICVESFSDALQKYNQGIERRKVDGTEKNSLSSRSHCIFSVSAQREGSEDPAKNSITFVDLAGSESLTSIEKDQKAETLSINKGLHSFGLLIKDLKAKRSPCNFRTSNLTKLLARHFLSKSRLFMIFNICEVQHTKEDIQITRNTLDYAEETLKVAIVHENCAYVCVNAMSPEKSACEDWVVVSPR